MPNMRMTKNPMPSQDPNVRNKNFKEVTLGYTEEMALDEAQRCLNCKNMPCVSGCPVNIHIPEFIKKVAEHDFEGAYQVIAQSSSLPAVCGRVCPQETQCEGKCVRGIKGEPVGIGRLERFVADWHNAHATVATITAPKNGHKVAVIGSGPAGLTCAGDLAKLGYDVTIYEALHLAGGVLVYGIPEFRLPKSIVQKEVDNLQALGVKVETNMVIGRILTIEELKDEYGYEAVFVGTGAGLPRFMNIPGENLKGVYSANEFLTRSNLMKAYRDDSTTPIQHAKNVAVVGGGNVAMDAARTAKRLGAENVYIIYRRGMAELPARKEEVEHAEEEGIIFHTLTNPVEILPTDVADPRDPNYGWAHGACQTRGPCAIIAYDKIVHLSRTKEVLLYDARFRPAAAGLHRRQPQLLPCGVQSGRPSHCGGLYAPVRAGPLDSDSRRPVLRHPQQLQHPRLSRTPEADRRLHDGRGPQ